MKEAKTLSINILNLNKYLYIAIGGWTLLAVIIFVLAYLEQKREVVRHAKIQALSSFQKDILYRRWSAG